MYVWVILAFWLVAGLGIFFVAFRGGRRRAPDGARGGDSRSSRRATFLISAAFLLVFGIGLPALVLASNGHSKSKNAVGGVDLSNAQVNGRKLFAKNCATCHTLHAVNAVGRVGPNLDELRPPKELVANAIQEGRARGNGQMPAELVTGKDAQDVASFVGAVAGRQLELSGVTTPPPPDLSGESGNLLVVRTSLALAGLFPLATMPPFKPLSPGRTALGPGTGDPGPGANRRKA